MTEGYNVFWANVLNLNVDEKFQLVTDIWDNISGVEVNKDDWPFSEIWKGVLELGKDEKIQLAMDTWDSIPDEEKPGLTEEQKTELDRRIAKDEAAEAVYYTWKEVKQRIEGRLKN